MIRLVTFDALHTLITPRLPIYVQYSQTFTPYIGTLDPRAIKSSFKTALKEVQAEKPVYASGHEGWWSEVIRRTAIGAGAKPRDVDEALPEMVPRLLKRFSSKEGYKLFDDVHPTLRSLQRINCKIGLVSNADSRILDVLADLEILSHLDPILISEKEGIEKPNAEIFHRACRTAGVKVEDAVHVGDEKNSDYFGAKNAGMDALLLRRSGLEGEGEHKDENELLSDDVRTISSLLEVAERVRQTSH
ncbi:HAD hydrolase subfamily IA REG-2-like protein [Rickenella mellea]|uniref:HAD hydrolase subfamily IA REG-2-like protein n=1 Tax=Rickenella mellea TaxID=50990 RepID=A0A4Y7QF44_9AGAM|nr:HAD hydrolase subfamily IA REG-2-like protein [Rickenella mellea]